MTSRIRKKNMDGEYFEYEPISSIPPMHVHLSDEADSNIEDNRREPVNLTGDRANILLLIFLYVLQGIPLGLSGSISMILSSRHVGYKDQAVFSFAFWPFSVKLLWAPIVDAVYSNRIGRRKSWLVPTQYLIGLFMVVLSSQIPSLLGEESKTVNVVQLTAIFFMMNMLAATQDIAVDGWALTMLKRENVGWASTCNTVGQTAGFFLGNVVFLALESADFCNKYLRNAPQKQGLVTLGGFTFFWGIVFFVTTTLLLLLKHEKSDNRSDSDIGVVDTYKQLYRILRLPSVLSYVAILLTCKVGFAAADAITGLKLIETGFPKEKLALMAVPMVPIDIILPFVISKYTAGPRPMNVFLKAMPYRLVIGLWYAVLVYLAPSVKVGNDFPYYFYALILGSFALHQVAVYCMFVALMSFNAKISDPAIGGTYMTLLNTLSNLGGNWPSTLMLWFVDYLTWKSCTGSVHQSCMGPVDLKQCELSGGQCVTQLDGYYIESAVCFVVGVLWLFWKRKKLQDLQEKPLSSWKCTG